MLRLLIFLCLHVVQALPEASPSPPPPPLQDVHVDNWQLTWTPTIQDRNMTYSVQYSTLIEGLTEDGEPVWKNASECFQTSLNSCDVGFTKAQAKEHGCVRLRVQAHTHGQPSSSVNACSRHSDSCTPKFNLTAHIGSLTVLLSRNRDLHREHADHVKHRVYFGEEGEPLKKHRDSATSVTIRRLEEGQRYCFRVQYIYHGHPIGLSTCPQCEVILQSTSTQAEIIVSVVVVVVLVLTTLTAYIVIFKLGKIKQWLRPPCQMPNHLLREEHIPIYTSSPSEEIFDPISSITPVE